LQKFKLSTIINHIYALKKLSQQESNLAHDRLILQQLIENRVITLEKCSNKFV